MNTIRSPGRPGVGVDSAFPEQLVIIIIKVSTVPSRCHLDVDLRVTITQIGMRKPKYS
jgi:hypothetical protein